MKDFVYKKSNKYSDLKKIYNEVSGPGGLKLTEFIAEKMNIKQGEKLLDVGTNRGYQTCFLAKEYKPIIIGIDPWGDNVEKLMQNAKLWKTENNIIGLKVGVPKTYFADNTFDKIYSTTTLEMIRGMKGKNGYRECIAEIYRVLTTGGIFGMGEPMHKDVEIPNEIYSYVSQGDMPAPWIKCFATLEETIEVFESVGFNIIEAGYAYDSKIWWKEFSELCPDGEDDSIVINLDKDRWLSFGYIIAEK